MRRRWRIRLKPIFILLLVQTLRQSKVKISRHTTVWTVRCSLWDFFWRCAKRQNKSGLTMYMSVQFMVWAQQKWIGVQVTTMVQVELHIGWKPATTLDQQLLKMTVLVEVLVREQDLHILTLPMKEQWSSLSQWHDGKHKRGLPLLRYPTVMVIYPFLYLG